MGDFCFIYSNIQQHDVFFTTSKRLRIFNMPYECIKEIPHSIAKYTTKRPTVPGSHKAEGAKNLRVPNTYICSYNVKSLEDQNKLEEYENELSETRFKWNSIGLSETEKKGRTSCAAKWWTRPIHKRRRKTNWRSWISHK